MYQKGTLAKAPGRPCTSSEGDPFLVLSPSSHFVIVVVFFLIASQLIEYPHGNGIDVIFAGGRREFMPNNVTDPEYPSKKGDREDGRNLTEEWVAKYPNSVYVWNKKQFDEIDPEKTEKVMGW